MNIFLLILKVIFFYSSIHHSTPLAKNLIKQILIVDSYNRFTVAQALNHPWIDERQRLVPRTHLHETVVTLKKLNARRKFKVSSIHSLTFFHFHELGKM